MIRRVLLSLALAAAGHSVEAHAQTVLTLDDAVARAMTGNAGLRVAAAGVAEAQARVDAAHAAFWPTADLTESWQRGNQPVFVFSSLLGQRQFTAANFAIEALNHPDAIDNHRVALTLEAPLYDPTARSAARAAAIGADIAGVTKEGTAGTLRASVTAAYAAVLAAEATRASIEAALARADADRLLAEQRRDVGLSTDADVLQMAVHVARTRQQQIQATADIVVARARLNQLMGVSADDRFTLQPPPIPSSTDAVDDAASVALRARADARVAALNETLAAAAVDTARAAFLPRVSAIADWEANGGTWNTRATGWVVGAMARINLFHGFGDTARLAEALQAQLRRRAERQQVVGLVGVDVRAARARRDAAIATLATTEAVVAQAVESHRILRDRYEAGLADVTAFLRAAEARQTAEAARIAAQSEVVVADAAWQLALGR